MDLNKVTYFLITGASRGIGQKIAVECSKKFKAGSLMVLLARSSVGLEETKNLITEGRDGLTVKTYSVDLAEPSKEDLQNIVNQSLAGRKIDEFELAYIVHNAGSVGDPSKKAADLDDTSILTQYFKLNFVSVAVLNSIFMSSFEKNKKVVVNISSKCGILPFKTLSLYGSGKAAREMFFKVLALEEPETVVLSYSPGPVDTDMFAEIEAKCCDNVTRKEFKGIRESNVLLTTEQTTRKLLKVLQEHKFNSGDHVDFFD